MLKNKITKIIEKSLGTEDVELEVPARVDHGDFSTNIAMKIFSSKHRKNEFLKKVQHDNLKTSLEDYKSPRQLAEHIVGLLSDVQDFSKIVRKIEVAGPGFINFWVKDEILIGVMKDVLEKGTSYGELDISEGKTVIAEYSSPNIAKPFTVGHLRSTVIGDAVANLLEATGWKVYRDNHLGDWGTQFGKQIYAIKTWGDEKEIENSENPVKELVELYVKFHKEAEKDPSLEDKGREWFRKLEKGDNEARNIWKKCIEWSWQEFSKIYEILDVGFSKDFNGGRGLGESFFENKMDVVVQELDDQGLLKKGDKGAKLVFFKDDKYPPAMILKSDGTTLYHTRDLATDKYRKEMYNPDLIINEVGAEQKLYFKQLFEMEKMLGWFGEDQRVHVPHGLIRFKDKKMSTRKGNVIWMNDILDQAYTKARELGSESEDLVRQVAVGAIKWNDLKRDPKTEIIFDWDEILSMEGNSGPYLQYTYARTQSVLRNSKDKVAVLKDGIQNYSFNEEESSLLRHCIHYSGTILDAAKNYSPNLLANYLFELAQRYNAFYNQHRIVNADEGEEVQQFRIALTAATGQILKNGLGLLGIQSPEKM